MIDASRLKDITPISKEALENFERVYHLHVAMEGDPTSKDRHDILNTTKTIGGILKYIAELERK